jgi:hypothetical protein
MSAMTGLDREAPMLTKARTTALMVALAALAAAPTAALAKHGADDPPGDDRGGQVERGDDDGGSRGGSGSGGGGGDRGKRVAGSCTGGSTAKLKAKPDDGRLEVEFEVDQNRNGVPWTVVLTRDGTRVARDTRVTRAPSGSFSLRKLVANPAGADVIRAVATRRGETCTIRASWTR